MVPTTEMVLERVAVVAGLLLQVVVLGLVVVLTLVGLVRMVSHLLCLGTGTRTEGVAEGRGRVQEALEALEGEGLGH